LLVLVDRLTEKRFVKRDGRRTRVKRVRRVLLGTAGFSLAAGASGTLPVHLTSIARRLLRAAGRRMLEVKVSGTGVKAAPLLLT
jgi:hypothetical protein